MAPHTPANLSVAGSISIETTFFAKFVKALFPALDEQNILYLVERNYEHLPEYTANDIDFLISEKDKDKFILIVSNAAARLNFDSVLMTSAFGGGRLYFHSRCPSTETIRIDYMTIIHYRGIVLLNAERILAGRKRKNSFYAPSPGSEAALSLMIPLMYSGHAKQLYEKAIYKGALEDGNGFTASFKPYLPDSCIEGITNLVLNKKPHLLKHDRKKIVSTYIRQSIIHSAIGHLRFIFGYLHRIRKPTGMFVSVLGPDGSGKSTAIERLSQQIGRLYSKERFHKLHWRPGLLPQLRSFLTPEPTLEMDFTNPHSPQKRSRTSSFFRWLYYTSDYIIGYYLKLLPLKLKSTCIILDRYYYDIIVDPVRYGFNLPKCLIESTMPFIPKPDLTIYLDNEPQALHTRKHELPVEELDRQVKTWRDLIPSLPNARIVTSDKPLENVVHEVTSLILERRSEMTKRTLKIDPVASQYLWKSDNTDYIALPSKKDCRWIIPTNPKLAKKAWDFYSPNAFKGKLFKKTIRTLAVSRVLKILKSRTLTLAFADEHKKLKECLVKIFGRDDFVLALSTGTPGPFRKITAMALTTDADILGYIKIAENDLAIERIKNEAKILKRLGNSCQLSVIRAPECLYEGEIRNAYVIMESPASFEGKTGKKDFNGDYAQVLASLISKTNTSMSFVESTFYEDLKLSIDDYQLSFKELLQEGLSYLEDHLCGLDITFALSHGDFTPWNMLWHDDEVFLFDWESTNPEAPAGIDLIHFLFQTGFLLKKYDGKNLLSFITERHEQHYKDLSAIIDARLLNPRHLLLSYVLYMACVEDKPQLLSSAAVERRNLIKMLIE